MTLSGYQWALGGDVEEQGIGVLGSDVCHAELMPERGPENDVHPVLCPFLKDRARTRIGLLCLLPPAGPFNKLRSKAGCSCYNLQRGG